MRIVPKKGVIVSNITPREINDGYQVRELPEPFIIRTCGRDIDRDRLGYYRDAFRAMAVAKGDEETFQMDYSLHRLIIERCQNRFLVQLLNMGFDQTHRIRVLSGKLRRRLEDTRKEHLRIVELLLASRLDAAARAMAQHLERSKRAAFDSLYGGG